MPQSTVESAVPLEDQLVGVIEPLDEFRQGTLSEERVLVELMLLAAQPKPLKESEHCLAGQRLQLVDSPQL